MSSVAQCTSWDLQQLGSGLSG